MSFVQRELDRVADALATTQGAEYDRLFAAQQALAWSLDPAAYASPIESILNAADSREAARGCSAESHQPRS